MPSTADRACSTGPVPIAARAALAATVVALLLAGSSPTLADDSPSLAGDVTSPPSVAFVGDSTGARSIDEIREEVTRTRSLPLVLAQGGLTLDQALPAIQDHASRPDAPPIWVIAVGHAYTGYAHSASRMRTDISALLEAVAPQVDCVRWFEVTEEPTLYPGVNATAPTFNRLLRSLARPYDNVEVVDYAEWAARAPSFFFLTDGLHYTPRGEREMGRLVRQAADGCDPATDSGPFWDVPNTDPGAGAIAWVGDQHVLRALPNGTYRARIGSVRFPATRGMLAYAAWRRSGSIRGLPAPRWDDIPRRLRTALSWIDHERLASGFPDGGYHPDAVATRAHAVRLLWRVAGAPRVADRQPWVDGPDDLVPALRWLVATGRRSLFPGNGFGPNRPLSRAEVARLLAPMDAPPPGGAAPAPPAPPTPTEVIVLDDGPGPIPVLPPAG